MPKRINIVHMPPNLMLKPFLLSFMKKQLDHFSLTYIQKTKVKIHFKTKASQFFYVTIQHTLHASFKSPKMNFCFLLFYTHNLIHTLTLLLTSSNYIKTLNLNLAVALF